VLDLACGPGLYAMRLARLGHHCHGIDFGPASIAYAREQSAGLDCVYTLGDIRSTPYGGPYDLAMLIYGQFNVFRPREARGILLKAAEALRPGWLLLLGPHTVGCVRSMAHAASWSASTGGLFSDRPHLLLSEAFWDEEQQAATERFYVVDAASGLATRYAMTTLAYTEEEYVAVLADAGLVDIAFYPSLLGSPDPEQPGLLAITARRPMIPA